jgi:hypothetical protein
MYQPETILNIYSAFGVHRARRWRSWCGNNIAGGEFPSATSGHVEVPH